MIEPRMKWLVFQIAADNHKHTLSSLVLDAGTFILTPWLLTKWCTRATPQCRTRHHLQTSPPILSIESIKMQELIYI